MIFQHLLNPLYKKIHNSSPEKTKATPLSYIISISAGIIAAIILTIILSKYIAPEEIKHAFKTKGRNTEFATKLKEYKQNLEKLRKETEQGDREIQALQKQLTTYPRLSAKLSEELLEMEKAGAEEVKLYTGVSPKTGGGLAVLVNRIEGREISEFERRGLQEHKPEDFKLVAILNLEGTQKALVEDEKGKGFIFSEGTPIGKNWVVKKILKDEIQISEVGQEKITATLKLKKD